LIEEARIQRQGFLRLFRYLRNLLQESADRQIIITAAINLIHRQAAADRIADLQRHRPEVQAARAAVEAAEAQAAALRALRAAPAAAEAAEVQEDKL
jgi:hypothetical protein